MNVENSPNKSEMEQKIVPETKTFDEKNFTLLLHIDKTKINIDALRLLAEKNNFNEKEEVHVTILGYKAGNKIKKALKKLSDEDKQRLFTEI